MRPQYVSLAVEASLDCQACGEPITLRAMESRIACPACGAGCAIAWAELLHSAIRARKEADFGPLPPFARGERLSGATPGATLDVTPEAPECSGCHAPWNPALLEKIDGRTRAMACTACGHEEAARLVPAAIAQKLPSARWVVGEETPVAVSRAPGSRRPDVEASHRFHVVFRPET